MTTIDLFWITVVLALAAADLAATYSTRGNQSFSSRVRYWSARWPWLKTTYFAGALLLAYHWWGV